MTAKTKPKVVITAALKAEALRAWEDLGPTEAARKAGVSARTVQRWAKAAGLRPPEEVAAATAAAQAEQLRLQAVAYANLIPELTHIAERALASQLEMASLSAELLAATRAGADVPEVLAGRLRAAALLLDTIPARVLVAMSTRAIHDLQLLTGGDTERASGEVKVYLANLGDTGGEAPKVIDVTPTAVVRDAS